MRAGIRLLLFCFLLCLPTIAFTSLQAKALSPDSPQGCCVGMRGNVDGFGIIDLSDLSYLIRYLTTSGQTLPCNDAANVDGMGIVDLSDLSLLIRYLTTSGVTMPPCPSDTGLMDPLSRMAAVTAVEQQISALQNLPVDSFNQQLADFIDSRPEFEAVGVSDEGKNVWARFTDGVLYFVSNSFGQLEDSLQGEILPPDSIPAIPFDAALFEQRSRAYEHVTPRAAAAGNEELPTSAGFRVIRTVGSAYSSAITTTNRLKSWLKSNGYVDNGGSASVQSFRTVGGEGVLFYVGHGAVGDVRGGGKEYGLWTSDIATVANLPNYAEDLIAHRLCVFSAVADTNALGGQENVTRYGITSKFIQYYWANFAPNAMVVITACASDSVPVFRNAIQSKGGPAYFGWSASVSCKGGCYAAEFIFDRCLGANKGFPRENPKQRPFDISNVFADLVQRNFHIQPGGDEINSFSSTMRYHPGNSNFGLLAPSIKFLDLYAVTDELKIVGLFGEDPGPNGLVTVGGQPVTIKTWSPNEITCDIPVSGPGSAGPVIVEKKTDDGGFRKSNIVNLSEWRGTFTQTHSEGGSLKVTVTYDFHIRADIHSHRDVPGETPFKPITPFFQESDATAAWEAGGSGSWPDPLGNITYTYTWTGGGILPLFDTAGSTPFLFFNYHGSVDANQHRITLVNGAAVYDGLNVHELREWSTGSDAADYPGFWATTFDLELYDDTQIFYYYTVALDDEFGISASSRTALGVYVINEFGNSYRSSLRMEWPAIPAAYPPDPDEAQ